MSVGRYIRLALDVLTSDNALGEVSDRYHAAEGQRVESVEWCDEHQTVLQEGECLRRDWRGPSCRIFEATLILPPKAET